MGKGRGSDDSKKASSNGGSGLSSSGVWFFALLLITGSFCLTLVQLSKGLHDQLLVTKEQLLQSRKQLVQVGVEKETLLEQQREERIKVQRLRDKSALVSKELLEQQKRVRLLQYEVLAARQEKQFNVTMRYLMDRVINNREYHLLLNKNLKDRIVLERSLELMQNKVFNLTEQLSLAKTNLFRSGKSLRKAKEDVDELKKRLLTANEALNKTNAVLEHYKKTAEKNP